MSTETKPSAGERETPYKANKWKLLPEFAADEIKRLQHELNVACEAIKVGIAERDELKRQLADAQKEAKSWESQWKMYRDAWVRELGGWTVPKAHEIDSLVLTTRKRCVNPLLGYCATPHWLGKPTKDRTALQQTAHPNDSSCREWTVDNSEPNPRAEAAERANARLQAEVESRWILVSDGNLPKPWVGVLTWSSLESVMKCHYRGDGTWGIYSGDTDIVVTHWQPLPAPPYPSKEPDCLCRTIYNFDGIHHDPRCENASKEHP